VHTGRLRALSERAMTPILVRTSTNRSADSARGPGRSRLPPGCTCPIARPMQPSLSLWRTNR